MVIEDLYDMHVLPWLLLILTSYLTERSMIMTYAGASSSPKDLPGSSPQGAFLGIFFFVVKYNAASLRPIIPRIIFNTRCLLKRIKCNKNSCKEHSTDMHALYIDDLSEAEAVNLKKRLLNDPVVRPFPLNRHERTQHILPSGSILQQNLDKIEEYTAANLMKMNEKKSNIMIFNKSKKYDFPPEFAFSNGVNLDCIEEMKLLGITLNTSLRWASNTSKMCVKAMGKMWLLRRMKILKLEPEIVFDYYAKEVQPLLEQGVVVWNSGLTKAQRNDLERIQKVALRIIMGDNYTSYDNACSAFSVDKLISRRLQLCTNFAIKLYRSDRRGEYFDPPDSGVDTRQDKQLVRENISRTKRCYNAPHKYLARLVNQNKTRIEKLTK